MSIESELHELNKSLRTLTEVLTAFSSKNFKPTREAVRESFEAIPLNDQEVAEMAEQPEPAQPVKAEAAPEDKPQLPEEPVTAPAPEPEQPSAPTVEETMALAKEMLDAGQKEDLLQLLGRNFGGKRVTSLNDAERTKFCEIAKAGLDKYSNVQTLEEAA